MQQQQQQQQQRGGSGGRRVFEISRCAEKLEESLGCSLHTDSASYKTFARIGEGGFGTTFLASVQTVRRLNSTSETMALSPTSEREQRNLWSLTPGKSVVVKEIKKLEGESHNSESLQLHGRNLESMDIVKSISHVNHCSHPFIAKLLDSQYAITTQETPFEVFEFYAAGDAQSLLDHLAESDQPHKEATNMQWCVIHLSLQVAEALAYLHESNFIHFDLKIDNVFIDENGDAKLGDFGLARSCTLGKTIENPYYYWGSRCSSRVFTSIRWVPPEQLAEGSVQVDHSVDWYSLGAFIFHMVYRRLPFEEHRQKALESQQEAGDTNTKRRFLRIWKANTRPKVDDRPKLNQKVKNLLYNLLSFDSSVRLGKRGCGEVFQRLHGLCKDLDIRWLESASSTDIDKIRRMIRRKEFPRPYRVRLVQQK